MKDPTKAVRTMYVNGLEDIVTLYDGIAPEDASGTYGVITATSFIRQAIKNDNYFKFSVTVEIHQEFNNDGNSEGVDAICNDMLEILMPLNSSGYLSIDGFNQSEVTLENGANDAFQNDAMVIFRKTITLNHFLSEN